MLGFNQAIFLPHAMFILNYVKEIRSGFLISGDVLRSVDTSPRPHTIYALLSFKPMIYIY